MSGEETDRERERREMSEVALTSVLYCVSENLCFGLFWFAFPNLKRECHCRDPVVLYCCCRRRCCCCCFCRRCYCGCCCRRCLPYLPSYPALAPTRVGFPIPCDSVAQYLHEETMRETQHLCCHHLGLYACVNAYQLRPNEGRRQHVT